MHLIKYIIPINAAAMNVLHKILHNVLQAAFF